MTYELNGKKIKIPDDEIVKSMEKLELSKEEAVQMWLEDEGYSENSEQEELTKKAKDSGIMRTIHGAYSYDKSKQKTQRERVKKVNANKKEIVSKLFEVLTDMAENVNIEKEEKLITFEFNGKKYKLDLIETREKKK